MIVPIAVTLAVLLGLIDESSFPHIVGFHYTYASTPQRIFNLLTDTVAITRGATAVGVAWLALALSGRWESETSWVGWFGRVLGFGWIASCVGYRTYEAIMYLGYGRLVV
jgi:hypothetical protein